MKSIFHVLFYMRSRPNRDGLHPIIVRITINGRSACFNTQQNVTPDQWNQKRQRLMGRAFNVNTMNLALDTIKAGIVEKYTYYHILRREPINAPRLKDLYLGINDKPSTLIAYFDSFNKTQEKIVGKGISRSTHNKYTLTHRRLSSFIAQNFKDEDIAMERIDLEFIMKFEHYLRDDFSMCNNSVKKLMRIFRRIIMLAVFNGLITLDPFKHYKIKLERVERHYLTQEELDRIINKRFSIKRLEQVRDIFVFCCYTGLSYIDAINLHQENIEIRADKNKWLVLKRQKTNVLVEIRLFKPAIEIIEKYKLTVGDNRLLPVCTNQKLNSYLKEIVDCCRIHKLITFHTSRHTFSTTIALGNGMPIETLSRALGHTSIKSTLVYAKITDKKLMYDMEQLAVKLGI